MAWYSEFKLNKKRKVRCTVCDRVYPTLVGNIAIDTKTWVCDDCKLHAKSPRLIQPHQVRIIEKWHPDNDESNKCIYCGTLLWIFRFQLLVDREVQDVDAELFIKPHEQVISTQDCPNPQCPKGFGKKFNDLWMPLVLRPPWGVIPRELAREIPELRKTKEDPDEHERIYEKYRQVYHDKWWSEWHKLQRAPAGKGLLARWLSSFKKQEEKQ